MCRILVVDDEPSIGWGLREYFQDLRHEVHVTGSVESALEETTAFTPEAILLDVRLPGRDGLSALPDFRQRWGNVPVIVMTAFGDLNTAVSAVQQGAFDYLTKPFDLEQAGAALERALLSQRLLTGAPAVTAPSSPLLGTSPAMQEVFKAIALVAPTDVSVLITGETGTGKELAAQAIHRHSLRSERPFVPICLAALSPSVAESELFGHVRGAFTGATDDRPGLIELADEGTLFLDEIGDTPPALQVKLLRFLETGQYLRVGSGQLRSANVRIVAATHQRLSDQIAAGAFREDLLFRLRGFELRMPPLRERREDIKLLAQAFCAQARADQKVLGWNAEFEQALLSRQWSGNVRELRSAVEHAVILSRNGPLLPMHLPPEMDEGARPLTSSDLDLQHALQSWLANQLSASHGPVQKTDLYRDFLLATEPVLFSALLEHCRQNRAAAARMLGVDRTTLRTKLRIYGLDGESNRH
ncbi:response regulator [bacterium]|nr:response regulator [bacterium]